MKKPDSVSGCSLAKDEDGDRKNTIPAVSITEILDPTKEEYSTGVEKTAQINADFKGNLLLEKNLTPQTGCLVAASPDFEWNFEEPSAAPAATEKTLNSDSSQLLAGTVQTRTYQQLVSSAAVTFQELHGINSRSTCGRRGQNLLHGYQRHYQQ